MSVVCQVLNWTDSFILMRARVTNLEHEKKETFTLRNQGPCSQRQKSLQTEESLRLFPELRGEFQNVLRTLL